MAGKTGKNSAGGDTPKNIKILVGLGNPGRDYENTYHNAGFLLVDYLVENQRNSKFQIPNSKFLKSDTYMNESGGFVKQTLNKRGAESDELLLAHDDSDIELGKFKINFGRGAAGHRGVESVIKALGTKDFWRVRIGIRPQAPPAKAGEPRPVRRGGKAGEFVLKKISKTDKKLLDETFNNVSEEIKRFTAY